MKLDGLKNNKIADINLEENSNQYELTIPLKESFLTDVNDYYFTMEERVTERKIHLTHTVVQEIDDYKIHKVVIPFQAYMQTFLENDIWDLYVSRDKTEEIKKQRVKCHDSNVRFLSIVLSEQEKMFYPYITKNNRLSFRINDYFLYAAFDSINLANDEISFSGFFNFPPLYKTKDVTVNDIKLIVTNNLTDEELEVPIERYEREDMEERYPGNENLAQCGVRGNFNFSDWLDEGKKTYLKFYLKFTYTDKGKLTTLRSSRIRIKNHKDFPASVIVTRQNNKKRVLVKPTKKSKYLSLQIAKYNFKNEVKKKVKSKWINIRRGSALKKAYKIAFSLLGRLPVKKNTIVFESFLGKQYSDSPRAIYEYLVDRNSSYDMYWSFDRRHINLFEDKELKSVRRFSIKWLMVMARAEFWVSNSRLPLWIPKPNHTTYVQTWHGTPLKRLAADMDEVHMPGTNTMKYKNNFIKEASKWDYLISPNAYSTEIFKRAFQFDRKMIESGYPRNDFLIHSNNKETINQIKQTSQLPLDKKIILYAPTWRDNQFYAKGKYKFDLEMDLEKMKEELGEDFIIVLRLHYLVAENLDLSGYEGFVYDFSFHEDIRELYLISDFLITDYSSVFFDYANLKRPMLFFVYDIEEYRDKLRGFYFDFEEKAPGPLVKTTEEIISEIKKVDANGFHPTANEEAFYQKFCYLEDGNASKRVVEEIFTK